MCPLSRGRKKALSSVLFNHFREMTNHFLIENEKTSGQNDWKFYLFPNFIRLFHTTIKFYWQILKLVYNLHLQCIIVNNNNCTKGILFFENENQGYSILVGNHLEMMSLEKYWSHHKILPHLNLWKCIDKIW